MVFHCHRNAEDRHHSVAQRAQHRAAIAFDRLAHGEHRRLQPLHRGFGIQAGDLLRRADDVREQHGGLLEFAPTGWRRGVRIGLGLGGRGGRG
jgi:hypothetical protein